MAKITRKRGHWKDRGGSKQSSDVKTITLQNCHISFPWKELGGVRSQKLCYFVENKLVLSMLKVDLALKSEQQGLITQVLAS